MSLLLLPLPNNERISRSLQAALNDGSVDAGRVESEEGRVTLRRFPDGETYVRIETAVAGREVAVVCTLDRPDDKLLPLVFLAATARDLGAARVGLVAPYLAYMRQDRRFTDGEGITSKYFAALLSTTFDWLVTVDPHLHRRTSLGEIYGIPAEVVHAAPNIAAWIKSNIHQPMLVGPDSESAQWVTAIAEAAGAPPIVLQKVRRGDRDVSVSIPDAGRWRGHTPILVDDIVSTARTMIATVRQLTRAGFEPPVCIGVHAVFAPGAEEELRGAGVTRVVTCNTIPHPTNEIDLSMDLARGVRDVRAGIPGAAGEGILR